MAHCVSQSYLTSSLQWEEQHSQKHPSPLPGRQQKSPHLGKNWACAHTQLCVWRIFPEIKSSALMAESTWFCWKEQGGRLWSGCPQDCRGGRRAEAVLQM